MPPNNNSLDWDSSNSCIYCGEYVPPTRTTPRQKSTKSIVQSTKCTESPLNARIRKRKMLVGKLANKTNPYPVKRRQKPKRKPKKQMQQPVKTNNERCTEAPLSQPVGVPMMATSQLGAMPEESELSPMLKGIILGLRLGIGYNQELDMAAGRVAPINWDQFQELIHATPWRLNLLQEKETLAENLESNHVPGNPSQGSHHDSSIPVVIDSPSPSPEEPLAWHQGSAQAIDLTSICSQSDSRVLQFPVLTQASHEMQTVAENLARESNHVPGNPSQGAHRDSSIPAVIDSPSPSPEEPLGWHQGSAQAIDLTSICSQSDSRVLQFPVLLNHNTVPIEGAAVPNQGSVQEDDQMLQPDEETVQMPEVCLNEKKSQIISEDNNVEEFQLKPTQNE